VKRVQDLAGEEKRELRAFLLQKKWLGRDACSDEAKLMILALPLHELCGAEAEKARFAQVDGQELAPPGSVPSLLTGAFLSTCIYVYMLYVNIFTCVYVCVCVYIYVHIIYMYIYSRACVYIYVCVIYIIRM
jgi:hypothetical protein